MSWDATFGYVGAVSSLELPRNPGLCSSGCVGQLCASYGALFKLHYNRYTFYCFTDMSSSMACNQTGLYATVSVRFFRVL